MGIDPNTTVPLLPIVASIHEDISESMCEEVFREQRDRERQRKWTLHKLVEFWIAVVLRAPESLTQALQEVTGGLAIRASTQAFFERCQGLAPRFFREIYERFVKRVLPKTPPVFAAPLQTLRRRFPAVLVLDGSRLDAIAHTLKIMRRITCAVLPGCLFVTYDLFRGIAVRLGFSTDAAKAEVHSAQEALKEVIPGSLLLGDRLFAKPSVFETLRQKGLWGLFRRDAHVKVRRLNKLRTSQFGETVVEEFLVEGGGGSTAPKQTLRLIVRRKPHFELLTNVLESNRLTGLEALALYAKRWSVEKLFQDLKCVLNLHCFYAANPNAVAMQVYASAIVHTAMRTAQSQLAVQCHVEPEEFSTDKLFCSLATASHGLTIFDSTIISVQEANPGVPLNIPTADRAKWAYAKLSKLLVARGRANRSQRRRRRVCRKWKSVRHIPNARHFLE